jgi:hypothetical protein
MSLGEKDVVLKFTGELGILICSAEEKDQLFSFCIVLHTSLNTLPSSLCKCKIVSIAKSVVDG